MLRRAKPNIRTELAQNLSWLRSFYSHAGYGGEVQAEDLVFFALEDDRVIGVVRLASEHNAVVLRGMQVTEAHRGTGIGSALLDAMRNAMNKQVCFCLPYGHLEAFYARAGFRTAEDDQIPGFLLSRKISYENRSMNVIAMLREPDGLA